MFERIRIRLKKRRINRRVKRIKRLVKKGNLKKAEEIYVRALRDYKEFCKKAPYFEKLIAYHCVLHVYNMLAEKGDREEKPVIAREKTRVREKAVRAKKAKEKKEEKAGKREEKTGEKAESGKEALQKTTKPEEKTEKPEPEKEVHEKKEMYEKKHDEEKIVMEKTIQAAQKPLEKPLTTLIDELYSFVQEKGNTTIADASLKFKVSRDRIEEWAKILEEHDLIKLYYPAFTSPQLMSIAWVGKQDERKRKAAEETKRKKEAKKKARKKQ